MKWQDLLFTQICLHTLGVPKEHEQKKQNLWQEKESMPKKVGFYVKYANNMHNKYWPKKGWEGYTFDACMKLAFNK